MTWVSWRLQRTETIVTLGMLALLAAFLVPTGLNMWDAYHHDGLARCLALQQSPGCMGKVGNFRFHFQTLSDNATWFTLVPGLLGVLLAAPFVTDLESGTYRLAWTQSVTRRQWLLGKLGLPVLTALAASGVLILLFTWWRGPFAHLDGRLDHSVYDMTGTVVIGYTLFALGLALALGVLWRRVAASLIVAFVGYFAVRLMVDYKVRAHLVAPARTAWHGVQQPRSLQNADVMSIVGTLHGHTILSGGDFTGGAVKMVAPGMRHAFFQAVYQPQSHFWPMQLTETALFAGVALLLVAFAAWRVLRAE
ncbi:MAG TPA: hypothetical protein VGH79_01800 [Gaiellaceae bacterium]